MTENDCPATPDGLWCDCEPGDPNCNYERAEQQASDIFRHEIESAGRARIEQLERPMP